MSCLLKHLAQVRSRTVTARAWSAMTRAVGRDRRLRWRYPQGGYCLLRSETAEDFDEDYPVAVASPQAAIAEILTARPVTTGELSFALRSYGPLGVPDAGDPMTIATLELVDGVVQPVRPNGPIHFRAEPFEGGSVLFIVEINNHAGLVPAASVVPYGMELPQGGGMDWDQPLGDPQPVGPGRSIVRFAINPNVAHGTLFEVGVRARSAAGAEDQNTDTRIVEIDSEGPPAMTGFTAEAICP